MKRLTLDEAKQIAFETTHSLAAYRAAARVLLRDGQGRDDAAYAQLATLKALYWQE
jgi:hypothetical protein